MWRRGCRPACRVVVRGVCGVWCDFHVEDIAGCCCLVICNLSPPAPSRGGVGLFSQVGGVFCFLNGGVFFRFSFIFGMVFDVKKPPGGCFSSGVVFYMGGAGLV